MSIYDFSVKDIKQNDVPISDYKGKVLLIVNTATGCGFTPQYKGLEELYETYRDQGLEILDFPCNQFMNQAPGSDEEIVKFCQVNFGTKFQTFSKIEVNGKNAHPLYTYLKQQYTKVKQEEPVSGLQKLVRSVTNSDQGTDIKWNFTKFLVDREGNVVARFAPNVKPENLKEDLEKLL